MADPLADTWRMAAFRGALAILFGVIVLLWRGPDLGALVTLFAAYVFLDGAYTLAWVVRVPTRTLQWWPVALEGVVSVGLGLLALFWPFISHRMIDTIAWWGIVTGVLEILAAVRLPRELASHWLLGMGGVASLFLAVLVWMLPHADARNIAWAIGAYALVFGVLVSLVAYRVRRRARAAGLGLAGLP